MRFCHIANLTLLLVSWFSHASTPINVATFNLYNRPWERKERLENAKFTLREIAPDIIFLQEVAEGWFLPGDPMKMLADFPGDQTKLYSIRHWHETNLGIFKTGLGVFSRFPIHAEYREFGEHSFWDAKGLQIIDLETPLGKIRALHLHLDSANNEEILVSELQQVRAAINPSITTLIIGDFNLSHEHPLLKSFQQETGAVSLSDHLGTSLRFTTWTQNYRTPCNEPGRPPAALPDRLDHIFLISPTAKFISGGIHVSKRLPYPSDHCPVFATLSED